MVYCGKPSRGCQNCKTRRIKCDEVRPCCTQCRKSNRVCPGYPDEFDLIFRNETAAVKRRAQRAFSNASSKSASPRPARKPSVTPSEVSLVWETSLTDYSPKSEKLEWLDEHPATGTPPSRRNSVQVPGFQHWDSSSSQSPELAGKDISTFSNSRTSDHGQEEGNPQKELLQLHPQSLDSPGLRLNHAVSFFFQHLVQMPRSKDSLRGYVEVLTPLYFNAKADSILHQAVNALALATMSNGQKSPLLRVEARKLYGRALREVGNAIKDPVQAKSDETLMTIMLFSLYEAITSTDDSRTVWTRHVNGAVTLVKMRGETVKKDPISLHLFRAVRAAMLTASIQQGVTIEDFPSPNGWRLDEDLGVNAANRLTLICINLPNIKYYAQDLLGREKDLRTVFDMMKLIQTAKNIDSELEHWALTLDPIWEPRVSMTIEEEPEDYKTALYWKGPVHVYQDLQIANVWNDYRVSRIFCQAVILGCVAALPASNRTGHIERVSSHAVAITQAMVDDFCSAVPFLLGMGPDFEAKKVGRLDQAAMKATGAYFAVWPLFVTKKIPTISERQKKWLLYRLCYIGKTFGLSEDQVLSLAKRHAPMAAPQFSYEEVRPVSRKNTIARYGQPGFVDELVACEGEFVQQKGGELFDC